MRKLGERLHLAKIVLSELKKRPLGRTELEKRTIRQFGTHSAFEGIFRYLVHARASSLKTKASSTMS
jgi:hypothetical protein